MLRLILEFTCSIVQCTMYNVHCTIEHVHCTLYIHDALNTKYQGLAVSMNSYTSAPL